MAELQSEKAWIGMVWAKSVEIYSITYYQLSSKMFCSLRNFSLVDRCSSRLVCLCLTLSMQLLSRAAFVLVQNSAGVLYLFGCAGV
jgi:hypothetical protein